MYPYAIELFKWISHVPPILEFIILVGAAIGAFLTIRKYVWRPIMGFHKKVNRGMDSILGYEPVLDPATGRVIQEATPPLANRVYELETANTQIAEALTTLAATQQQVVRLEEKWNERETAGLRIVEEWNAWRDSHEKEAREREDRIAEWEVWRQEQTLLHKTIAKGQLPD